MFGAVTTVVHPIFLRYVLAMDAMIVFAAACDAVLARSRVVSVERRAADVLSLGRPNRVEVTLRSRSRRRAQVLLSDDLFDEASSPELPAGVTLEPRAATDVVYHVIPKKRGAYELGSMHVRVGSPFGLWWRQLTFVMAQPVRVYPDLLAIRAFDLMARRERQYDLVRAVRRKGGETEFERLREYNRDDEFRSVDWKATARRQRLTVREYQLESNQSILFMLDAGRLMTAETAGASLFDHALNATLLLSHIATRGGDWVGMLGFDDAIRAFVTPSGARGAARRLIQTTYDLHPRLVEPDFARAFDHVSARVRKRSLVILFTQIVDKSVGTIVVRRARALQRRHLPLIVLFRDPDLEALVHPDQPSDTELYAQGAAAELLHFRDGLNRELRAAGALVLDVKPRELTTALINRYLDIKARHLL